MAIHVITLVSCVQFLLVLPAVLSTYTKECSEEMEGTRVIGMEKEKEVRVASFEGCQEECSKARKCIQLVFTEKDQLCTLYQHSLLLGKELIPDPDSVYSFLRADCMDALAEQEIGKRRFPRQTGQWGAWGSWGGCSVTCGLGVDTQRRTCSEHNCKGSDTNQRSCTKGPCMQWQAWTAWTSCSSTCGNGTRTRTRFCPNYYGCGPINDNMERASCMERSCGVQYDPWQGWSACSTVCGGGVRNRHRDCPGYGCAGDAVEDQQCNTHSCCTSWGKWGRCSITCGEGGVDRRRRMCTVEDKNVPTGYASKTEYDERPCASLSPCGQWSEWGEWEECSRVCGQGERRRERLCSLPGECDGEGEDFQTCNNGPCAIWREWSDWSYCDATCGGGRKDRQRLCSQDGMCQGDPTQTQECGRFPCPTWGNWGPWSYCSASCGGGWQKRGRVCNMYNMCGGDNKEKRLCNTHVCPSYGEWGEWGECTKPCGKDGYQLRERPCVTDEEFCVLPENVDKPSCFCEEGRPKEAQPCNAHQCADWNNWEAWGRCSASCAGGRRTRLRDCGNDPQFCIGNNKDHPSCLCGADPTGEEEGCNDHQCAEWSSWEEWGACSSQCGGGARERKRTCVKDEEFCAGQTSDHPSCTCPGLDHSNEMCNAHPCPRWTPWGRWSECSVSCEGGVKRRNRECEADMDLCVGANVLSPGCLCEGDALSEAVCNSHQCAEWVKWTHWSECSASCEGGVQKRTRHCQKDFSYCFGMKLLEDPSCRCEGGEDAEQSCNAHVCPQWSPWEEWSPCSASCDGGVMDRVRNCEVDADYCDDTKIGVDPACMCGGTGEQTETCNQVSCPSWMNWGDWSSCSASCGEGRVQRKRGCSIDVRHCQGDAVFNPECVCDENRDEEAPCDGGPCFVWAVWEEWSSCTTVCGGGSRNRTRQCPEEGSCPGIGSETGFCSQIPCPDWSEWSPWSDCSATCGNGQRARTRSCAIKGGCSPGEPLEIERCNPQKCPIWSQWGEWSSCSRSCGEGKRERTRDCTPIDGCLGGGRQSEPCSIENCLLATYWSEWSPCSQTCGGGLKTRARVPCPTCAVEEEMDNCSEHKCPTWAGWLGWAECSQSCGGGYRLRSRKCEYDDGSEVERGCIGRVQEIDANPCNDFSC